MRLLTTVILALLLLSIAGTVTTTSTELFPYMGEFKLTDHFNSFFVVDVHPSAAATMSASLKDLRFYAGRQELGYSVLPPEGSEPPSGDLRRMEVVNEGMLDDRTFSFTIVTAEARNQYLRVKLAPEPYLAKGLLFGSNDNRTWQELKPVTFFSIDGRSSDLSLSGIDYDYLKINFTQPPGETLTVASVWLLTSDARDEDTASLEQVPFTVSRDEIKQESILTADLQYKKRLSSLWLLQTQERGFYRQLVVEGSDTGSDWNFIASTYVFRGIDSDDELLSLSYMPVKYRYIRLRIMDEDNEPVRVDAFMVRTHPVKALVKLPSSLEHTPLEIRAFWGNDNLKAPSYDVDRLLGTLSIDACPVFTLEGPSENPDYRETEPQIPFTERYPFLLPLGLAAAVLIIALLLYRNVKKVNDI